MNSLNMKKKEHVQNCDNDRKDIKNYLKEHQKTIDKYQ